MTLDHEVEVLEHQFARNSVHTLHGMARFQEPHTLKVTLSDDGELVLSSDKFIIATGSQP